MALGLRRKHQHFDVPVQDMMLHVSGSEDLYEEARAVGMQFWEQIQSYGIRHPLFRTSKRPIDVPDDAPEIIRQMATMSATAGVGPMFGFRGALTEFVGRRMASVLGEVVVTCAEDHFVATNKRGRLGLQSEEGRELALVIRPELGPIGVFSSLDPHHLTTEIAAGLVVVATSCILADAAAAGATAILSKPNSMKSALAYLKRLPGVHGGMVIRGDRIGVAGAIELAA